ncbi:MAG TPA: ABC transporter ATP-binding protein [Streptomyces sp.]|uniref:ABC transporter ATP-binding protein n=1 Tax=Streptomyces sp. TaxID=1931 RepID=UPI002D57A5C5|nr:ABC transporter ATP-binding protein [Streptomyces sp.]HZG03653.1 ABC transporter ATP-binding protein [Streptomyces sp.]
MRSRRRGAADEPVVSESERTLFGGRLVYDTSWAAYEETRYALGLRTMIATLPRLLGMAVGLSWRADRRATVAVAVAETGRGVAQAGGLLGVNALLAVLLAGGDLPDRLRQALPVVLAVAGAAAAGALCSAASTRFSGPLQPKVERLAREMYLERAYRVELAAMEDEEFHRLLESAQYGAASARRMTDNCVAVVSAMLSLVAAAGVLTVLHPLLLPALVLMVLPGAWATLVIARRRYRSFHRWLQHTRASLLLSSLLTDTDAAAEVRVHGVGPFVLEHFRGMSLAGEEEQTRLARLAARTELLASALTGLVALGAYALLGALLWTGVMALAAAGTAVVAIRTGTGALEGLVRQINYLHEESLHVADLNRLLHESAERQIPTGGARLPADVREIRLEDVGFAYPGTDGAPALRDVSLTVPLGGVVALVGENGSGKSTLVKLLCGLYAPQRGRVLWCGADGGADVCVDAAEADRQEVFARFAVVAQDHYRWPMTARVNVAVSDTRRPICDRRVAEAARHAGADFVEDLPRGWHTLLSRTFKGGHQLSGGQWQRLGIARARYRDGEILVVDEPTAALDAKAEERVFRQLRELADAGQTIVLITHRMASVRHADLVHVLHEGRLVESGSPADLLARPGGHFRELYETQAAAFAPPGGRVPAQPAPPARREGPGAPVT